MWTGVGPGAPGPGRQDPGSVTRHRPTKWDAVVSLTDELLQGTTRVFSYSAAGIGRNNSSETGWTARTRWVGPDSGPLAPGLVDVMTKGASSLAIDVGVWPTLARAAKHWARG